MPFRYKSLETRQNEKDESNDKTVLNLAEATPNHSVNESFLSVVLDRKCCRGNQC